MRQSPLEALQFCPLGQQQLQAESDLDGREVRAVAEHFDRSLHRGQPFFDSPIVYRLAPPKASREGSRLLPGGNACGRHNKRRSRSSNAAPHGYKSRARTACCLQATGANFFRPLSICAFLLRLLGGGGDVPPGCPRHEGENCTHAENHALLVVRSPGRGSGGLLCLRSFPTRRSSRWPGMARRVPGRRAP